MCLGPDPCLKSHSGRTPLHIMCATNHGEGYSIKGCVMMPIDFAISRTTNLDLGDKDGITPLHLAAISSQLYTKNRRKDTENPSSSSPCPFIVQDRR
ncbi:ankyrin repeat domain-containing protein [Candidatus Bathyarchaeota archaeon]|nr:ankyrin repeat domain-containing protein [Candidatus Bathyarchaeota archaeon]